MAPAPANFDAPTVTTPAADPALAAWQERHVERFRQTAPPCHCFACLSARVVRSSGIRRSPLEFFVSR
jgi:hypothetical protein